MPQLVEITIDGIRYGIQTPGEQIDPNYVRQKAQEIALSEAHQMRLKALGRERLKNAILNSISEITGGVPEAAEYKIAPDNRVFIPEAQDHGISHWAENARNRARDVLMKRLSAISDPVMREPLVKTIEQDINLGGYTPKQSIFHENLLDIFTGRVLPSLGLTEPFSVTAAMRDAQGFRGGLEEFAYDLFSVPSVATMGLAGGAVGALTRMGHKGLQMARTLGRAGAGLGAVGTLSNFMDTQTWQQDPARGWGRLVGDVALMGLDAPELMDIGRRLGLVPRSNPLSDITARLRGEVAPSPATAAAAAENAAAADAMAQAAGQAVPSAAAASGLDISQIPVLDKPLPRTHPLYGGPGLYVLVHDPSMGVNSHRFLVPFPEDMQRPDVLEELLNKGYQVYNVKDLPQGFEGVARGKVYTRKFPGPGRYKLVKGADGEETWIPASWKLREGEQEVGVQEDFKDYPQRTFFMGARSGRPIGQKYSAKNKKYETVTLEDVYGRAYPRFLESEYMKRKPSTPASSAAATAAQSQSSAPTSPDELSPEELDEIIRSADDETVLSDEEAEALALEEQKRRQAEQEAQQQGQGQDQSAGQGETPPPGQDVPVQKEFRITPREHLKRPSDAISAISRKEKELPPPRDVLEGRSGDHIEVQNVPGIGRVYDFYHDGKLEYRVLYTGYYIEKGSNKRVPNSRLKNMTAEDRKKAGYIWVTHTEVFSTRQGDNNLWHYMPPRQFQDMIKEAEAAGRLIDLDSKTNLENIPRPNAPEKPRGFRYQSQEELLANTDPKSRFSQKAQNTEFDPDSDLFKIQRPEGYSGDVVVKLSVSERGRNNTTNSVNYYAVWKEGADEPFFLRELVTGKKTKDGKDYNSWALLVNNTGEQYVWQAIRPQNRMMEAAAKWKRVYPASKENPVVIKGPETPTPEGAAKSIADIQQVDENNVGGIIDAFVPTIKGGIKMKTAPVKLKYRPEPNEKGLFVYIYDHPDEDGVAIIDLFAQSANKKIIKRFAYTLGEGKFYKLLGDLSDNKFTWAPAHNVDELLAHPSVRAAIRRSSLSQFPASSGKGGGTGSGSAGSGGGGDTPPPPADTLPENFRVRTENILDDDAEVLVNPTNTLGISGAGLAKQFAERFPANADALREAGKNEQLAPGKIFAVKNEGEGGPKFIVNLHTKRHYGDKSKLEDIEQGLDDLVRFIRENKIKSVAVPALGSGLGGLDYDKQVLPLIVNKLKDLKNVEVRLYRPKDQKYNFTDRGILDQQGNVVVPSNNEVRGFESERGLTPLRTQEENLIVTPIQASAKGKTAAGSFRSTADHLDAVKEYLPSDDFLPFPKNVSEYVRQAWISKMESAGTAKHVFDHAMKEFGENRLKVFSRFEDDEKEYVLFAYYSPFEKQTTDRSFLSGTFLLSKQKSPQEGKPDAVAFLYDYVESRWRVVYDQTKNSNTEKFNFAAKAVQKFFDNPAAFSLLSDAEKAKAKVINTEVNLRDNPVKKKLNT